MGWLRRLRTTVLGSRREQDFEDEARFHLEQRAQEYVRHGMSAEEAQLEAKRRFGSVALAHDRTRDVDTLPWLRDFGTDVRYATRMLRKAPGFAVAAVLTLALAIGANAAIFAVTYGVLLQPLPYPESDRLVRLSEQHLGARSPLRDAVLSNLTFDAWRTNTRTLVRMAAYSERAYSVTGIGDAERVRATSVSLELFDVLGIAPAAGRFFLPDEALEESHVVLSYAYWQRKFGGRTDVVGHTIVLDGRARVIVGVAPSGFSFPDLDRQLFTPFVRPRSAPTAADRQVHVFLAVGRLAPSVTASQAAAEGTSIARALGPRPAAADMLFGKGGPVIVHARGIVDEMTMGVRPILLLLSAGVVLVLLLGCANVANLCLSRGLARERELALRAALGAGRGRLLRQLFAESLAVSSAAAVLGVFLAWGLLQAWPLLAPRDFPRLADIGLTWGTALYTVLVSVLAGALVGAAPALQALRVRPAFGMREGIGASTGLRHVRTRQSLLVLQAAVAVVLLVGAALLMRGFDRLVSRDTGYDATHVTTARVSLQAGPATPQRWQQVATGLVERLHALPGIAAVGAANMAPLGDSTHLFGFRLSDDRAEPIIARALGYIVTPGYAETLGLRLRQGRFLDVSDVGSATPPMVVNEEFVRTYLTDGRPVVGRRYNGIVKAGADTEIVGIVGDVLKGGLTDAPQAEFYVALGNHGAMTFGREITLVIRSSRDSANIAALRAVARDVDPNAPVHSVRSLAAEVSASAGQSRFALTVVAAFALLALGLAALGLHGGLMYSLSRRTRELGIRSALGASRGGLVAMVMQEVFTVTVLGLLLGLVAAGIGTRALRGLLFGVDPLDGFSFAVAPAMLALASLAACVIPAWRLATLNPTDVLRHD